MDQAWVEGLQAEGSGDVAHSRGSGGDRHNGLLPYQSVHCNFYVILPSNGQHPA